MTEPKPEYTIVTKAPHEKDPNHEPTIIWNDRGVLAQMQYALHVLKTTKPEHEDGRRSFIYYKCIVLLDKAVEVYGELLRGTP